MTCLLTCTIIIMYIYSALSDDMFTDMYNKDIQQYYLHI